MLSKVLCWKNRRLKLVDSTNHRLYVGLLHYASTLCGVWYSAHMHATTFRATFGQTHFSADSACQRNLQTFGMVHKRKRLRGPTSTRTTKTKFRLLQWLLQIAPVNTVLRVSTWGIGDRVWRIMPAEFSAENAYFKEAA